MDSQGNFLVAWTGQDGSSDGAFVAGSTVTSGARLLTGTTYAPPPSPLSPVLYVKVSGVDVNALKGDKNKKSDSQIVHVNVQP